MLINKYEPHREVIREYNFNSKEELVKITPILLVEAEGTEKMIVHREEDEVILVIKTDGMNELSEKLQGKASNFVPISSTEVVTFQKETNSFKIIDAGLLKCRDIPIEDSEEWESDKCLLFFFNNIQELCLL